jgi:hypothetical protein
MLVNVLKYMWFKKIIIIVKIPNLLLEWLKKYVYSINIVILGRDKDNKVLILYDIDNELKSCISH